MSAKRYEIQYRDEVIAVVEIEPSAQSAIKEMVEFWTDWENHLANYGGNYQLAWMVSLGMYILRNGGEPVNEEGWCPLDGSLGIMLVRMLPYQFDDFEIDVEEVTR